MPVMRHQTKLIPLCAVGELSYFITSHVKTSRLIEVNLNDIKKLHVPDTRGWTFKLTDRALIRNKAVLIDLIP